MSTQLSGLPFSGPIGGVRVALIRGQWVAFPTYEQLEEAVFDMVVAGRIAGDDVAIMMVEAEATVRTIELVAGGATAPTEEVVAAGLDAAKPFIRALCEAQQELAASAASRPPSSRCSSTTRTTPTTPSSASPWPTSARR
jgi:polyribonucleotide nucleotidyltransferase